MARFLQTHTSEQQHTVELKVAELYEDLSACDAAEREDLLLLLRDRHARYLQGGLGQLPAGFVSLDASKPWICYWVLHGLVLLEHPLPRSITEDQIIAFLSSCQHPTGGYGGGPGQMPHLAPTYAAISALLTLGGQAAYRSIDRAALSDFLHRMAIPPEQGGGFRMHQGKSVVCLLRMKGNRATLTHCGESDVRSCYTALAVASNLCLDTAALAAKSGVVDYIRRCQALNLDRLLHWAVQRQGWAEGGFNGRTNKLVDGCYSFWQGGMFPLLQELIASNQQQQLVPDSLNASCKAVTYPPNAQPAAWLQQAQEPGPPLEVPALPALNQVSGPLLQADREALQLNQACDQLTEAALKAAARAHQQQEQQEPLEPAAQPLREGEIPVAATAAGDDIESEPWAARYADEHVQELLARAQAAQKAAEYADENVIIAAASAAELFPCQLSWGGHREERCSQEQLQQSSQPQPPEDGTCTAAETAVGDAGSSAGDPNPLFNTKALQCWILRACQQLKGGLRDKPGKPADYYHSCYCLSGLATAQHIPGGGVVGCDRNKLKKTDPVVNIVEDKLLEAQQYFRALGPP
eukprot:gene2241-2553_t